jgi:DNA-binding protein YbaB
VVSEERLQETAKLQQVLASTVGVAEHPSGLATVHASARGELRAVYLHPALLNQGHVAVGQIVTETARLATSAAVQTSFNEIAKSLGDGMAMVVEGIAGDAPFRSGPPVVEPVAAPPPAPARRSRPPVDDDDEDAFFQDPFGRR